MLIRRLLTPRYIIVLILSALSTFFIFLTISLWGDMFVFAQIPFLSTADVTRGVMGMYLNPLIHILPTTLAIVGLVSILTGIHVTLLVYIKRYRKQKITRKVNPTGIVSTILVSLGMGCAACGSIILLSLASSIGIGLSISFVSWLTSIFMVLAIAILIYSIIKLYRQAQNPLVCEV